MKNLLIVWSEANQIGIPILDEQHRGVASIINTLYDFMPDHHDGTVLHPLLTMIELYVKVHFLTEERLFAKTKYPGAAAHACSHHHFLMELHQWIEKSKSSSDPTELLAFLKKLWIVHINEEDRVFAQYVKAYLEAHSEA